MDNSNSNPVSQTILGLDQIVSNLLLLLSDKERNVITKRFSLGTDKKFTLEEIGREFSVTRERVRQIEKSALGKMRRNVFNTSLRSFHEYVSDVLKGHGGFIKETELMAKLKDLVNGAVKDSALHLSLVLDDNVDCIGNTIDFHPYVKRRDMSAFSLKHVAENLINQLHKHGDVRKVEQIQKELKNVMEQVKFDEQKTKSLITIDKRLILLENDLVGLVEWRHVHPRTLRDKILFILRHQKKPMHFTDIANTIEDKDFDGRKVNLQAVHNELIRHEQFVLIGRGIYALSEWGYEKGTVAEVVEKILAEKGEMDQDEIISQVMKKRQVKTITIVLALKNSKKFTRVGRHRYALKKR